MIQHVTREELRAFAAKLPLQERTTLLKSASASSRTVTGTTFLSHSSKDEDLVVGAISVLENHGATAYVDEIDPEMPPYTTDETAALLKQRIHQTSRFVLLASKNSKESKWVPWELGVADGDKGLDRIALFPASDSPNDTAWASWEYLGLYRRIVWGNLEGHENPLWMVLDEKKNTALTLRAWLTRI
jgi:hypothetical protein